MEIRRLRSGEASLYREVRLKALRESPEAYASTYESAIERSFESWEKQAESTCAGSDRATFVVLSHDAPVGLAALYRSEDSPAEGQLFQVWISPESRGKAAAAGLMDAVFNWAGRHGFRKIHAQVLATNIRALRFYQNYGFNIAACSLTAGMEIMLTKQVSPTH
jgi:RimJ/RimL family protein N-acetyltransferase